MKKPPLETTLIFIQHYYLKEISHRKGYKELKHDEHVYLKLFPDNPDPLLVKWEIDAFIRITNEHFHTNEETEHFKDIIIIIKKCIYHGLTLIEINAMLGLWRGFEIKEVANQLGIKVGTMNKRISSVCDILYVPGYKQALTVIKP